MLEDALLDLANRKISSSTHSRLRLDLIATDKTACVCGRVEFEPL
jgi:hypothetical protein